MGSTNTAWQEQVAVSRRFGVEPLAAPRDMKVGVARNVASGLQPLNGLRHPPEGDTTGWYIWAGETLEQDPDFFQPMHVDHLYAIRPDVIPYLALPPGWRFLLAPDHEDVWQDVSLLTPA